MTQTSAMTNAGGNNATSPAEPDRRAGGSRAPETSEETKSRSFAVRVLLEGVDARVCAARRRGLERIGPSQKEHRHEHRNGTSGGIAGSVSHVLRHPADAAALCVAVGPGRFEAVVRSARGLREVRAGLPDDARAFLEQVEASDEEGRVKWRLSGTG